MLLRSAILLPKEQNRIIPHQAHCNVINSFICVQAARAALTEVSLVATAVKLSIRASPPSPTVASALALVELRLESQEAAQVVLCSTALSLLIVESTKLLARASVLAAVDVLIAHLVLFMSNGTIPLSWP